MQLVDPKTGTANWAFLKFLQALAQAVNAALNILGTFEGIIGTSATIEGHAGTVAHVVQNLTGTGLLNSLTNVAADVNLDHIADTVSFQRTTPDQVSGAGVAFTALVSSSPATNQALIWSGASWSPNDVSFGSLTGTPALANNTPFVFNKFLTSYDSTTGAFGQAQPSFGNISGNISSAQLPLAGLSVTVPLGPLTGGGTTGSLTFTNGILTAHVDPT
jgi:hypothetical protein